MWRYCKDYIISKCEDGSFIVTTNGIWKNPLGVSLPVTNISEILDINIGDNILTTKKMLTIVDLVIDNETLDFKLTLSDGSVYTLNNIIFSDDIIGKVLHFRDEIQ